MGGGKLASGKRNTTYQAFLPSSHTCWANRLDKIDIKESGVVYDLFRYESAGPDRGVDYRNLGALPVGGYPIKIRRATKSS